MMIASNGSFFFILYAERDHPALPLSRSTFWDVLHFAATCRHYRQIWTGSLNVVNQHVSPRAIPCRHYARILLAEQQQILIL